MQQNDRDKKLEEQENERKIGGAVQDCLVSVKILGRDCYARIKKPTQIPSRKQLVSTSLII